MVFVSTVQRCSPLLGISGAVAGPPDGPDGAVPWHFGDPFAEQRAAVERAAVVDRSHRFVLTIGGPQRREWLNSLTSQQVADLPEHHSGEGLDLDAHGRVQHHFTVTECDDMLWLDTEAERGADLLQYLQKMVFWSDVSPAAAPNYAVLTALGPQLQPVWQRLGITAPAAAYAAVSLPGGGFLRRMPWPTDDCYDLVVPRDQLTDRWAQLTDPTPAAEPAGLWAFEALRVAARRPRVGRDTDDRTIPHEVGWIGSIAECGAVALNKGCYRGQETVARVHNLGKPPRSLLLLHLDGSADTRATTGDEVTAAGRTVGQLGTVIDHYELGPLALALVKRSVTADTALQAGAVAAAVDPDSVPSETGPPPGRRAVSQFRRGSTA